MESTKNATHIHKCYMWIDVLVWKTTDVTFFCMQIITMSVSLNKFQHLYLGFCRSYPPSFLFSLQTYSECTAVNYFYLIFSWSHRSVTKEEKDKENTRKVAPVTTTMPPAGRPSSVQARPISGILQEAVREIQLIAKTYICVYDI